MTFRETLDRHLNAIRNRDLAALMDTISDDELVLIMSDGRVVRSADEFARLHESWFESKTWVLDAAPLGTIESPTLGIATFLLEYQDRPAGQPQIREKSILSLVFAVRNGRWLMVQDQNTPIKERVDESEVLKEAV